MESSKIFKSAPHWYILAENHKEEITPFDIFTHSGFYDRIEAILKLHLPAEEEKEKIRRELSYYFWSKCEWEIIVSTWPPYSDPVKQEEHSWKIDVYSQVMMNIDRFIEYLHSITI